MNFTRVASEIDVIQTTTKKVTVIGAAPLLACHLTRCGVRRFDLQDFDRVQDLNIPRQDFPGDEVGAFKVEAVARLIRRINAEAQVNCLTGDFTTLTESDQDALFADTDLFLFCTDSFWAQARGNELALRHGKDAVWVGLSAGARAGEIVFWHRQLDACWRCLMARRYQVQEAARQKGRSLAVSSEGADIFSLAIVDAIAGQIAVGLLTRGADNRFGRLIDQLGDRNFLQVKIDPTYTWGGRDIFAEQLGIAEGCPAYFSFVTIARSDPDKGQLPCPDCERFRGHQFAELSGHPVRIIP